MVRLKQYSIHHSSRDGFYLASARCFVCMSFRSYHGNSLDYYSSSFAQTQPDLRTVGWTHKHAVTLWRVQNAPESMTSHVRLLPSNFKQRNHPKNPPHNTCTPDRKHLLYLLDSFHKSLIAAQFWSSSGTFTNCWGRVDFVHLWSFMSVTSFLPCAMTECSCRVIFWLCHVWLNSQKKKKRFFDILNHYKTTQCWSVSKAPNNWVRLFGKACVGVKREGGKSAAVIKIWRKLLFSPLS